MGLVFSKETKEKYPERCHLIEKGYTVFTSDRKYMTADIEIIIENVAGEREWDENLRVLAGDEEDAGKWKIILPFDEYVGQVFQMHVVTAFTLIIYDVLYGEGAFNKIRNLDEYKTIYDTIDPYFAEIGQNYGLSRLLNVEVRDER